MKKFSTFILEADNIELNGFCILKPEFLEHEEDFLALLKNNGWKIVQKKKLLLTKEQSSNLYSPHKDKDFYKDLCDYMSSGECLCCSCHKDCENPIEDMKKLKDKVRENWGKDEMKNGMHSSDSIENVNRESKICLK
jgi:nucleoside-diphosphate kinase